MKRIFSNFKIFSLVLILCFITGCAFTHEGARINGEQADLERMERKRHSLESQYIIILNGLEKYPGDQKLEKERHDVMKSLSTLSSRIINQRDLVARSIREWEQKITDERVLKDLVEKEENTNGNKDDSEADGYQ